jgi:AcrR family transcriptional regulator
MNDIAREAGVSKGTLYVYFASKDALFAAYVREDRRRQAEQMIPSVGDAKLEDALATVALTFMREMLMPAHVAQLRTVVAAAAKFPDIGNAFYEAGPLYGQTLVAQMLTSRAGPGGLRIDDVDQAAIHFTNLVQGTLVKRALFCSDVPTPEEIEAAVREGIAMFLRMYSHGGGPG